MVAVVEKGDHELYFNGYIEDAAHEGQDFARQPAVARLLCGVEAGGQLSLYTAGRDEELVLSSLTS